MMTLALRSVPVILLVIALGASGAAAQEGRTVTPEEAQRMFSDWLGSVSAFIQDSRFGDEDVASYIENWDAFLELSREVEQEMVADWLEGGLFNYGRFLELPRYLEWARGRGLDPDAWLRRSTRILLMVMRQQTAETLEAADEQMPIQRERLQQMQAELSEEDYANAVAQLDAATELIEQTRKAYQQMLPPTAEEQAVLERQRERLDAYMGSE